MTTPRLLIASAAALALACAPEPADTPDVGQAAAQPWRTELARELVTIADGKMVYEEYGIVKLTYPRMGEQRYQVKSYAEAPVGAMTRDVFLGEATATHTMAWLSLFASESGVNAAEFFEAFDYEELKEGPIGTPDIEMNMFMTEAGLQWEVVNNQTDDKYSVTMTWDEVFDR